MEQPEGVEEMMNTIIGLASQFIGVIALIMAVLAYTGGNEMDAMFLLGLAIYARVLAAEVSIEGRLK